MSTLSAPRASSPDILLDVRDLRVTFGSGSRAVEVLHGVSFALERGETYALVGESGSGKSTVASSLLNLFPPGGCRSGGSLAFDGEDITQLAEREWRRLRGRRIAMVFQEAATALNPLLTVRAHLRESLLLAAGVRGRAADDRSRSLLEEVGISDPERRLGQYPHELSGGMRQRLLIALALAGDPQLLIADEPTTALDVTVQAQILELLRGRQRERGMTLLLITHSLPVVANVVRTVLVMYAGRLMETGEVSALFTAPRHPYTAALLTANPHVERDAPIRSIRGTPPDPRNPPTGCPFAPRCDYAAVECTVAPPPLVSIAPGRSMACVVDPLAPS